MITTGGVTGGITTGGIAIGVVAVIDQLQELVPPELVTTSVYGVVVLVGGVIMREPVLPVRVFPGFNVPVREPDIDHERIAPLPLVTLFGLIERVQLGGVTGGMTGGIIGGIMSHCNIQNIFRRRHD
jgi:hypothetical protein